MKPLSIAIIPAQPDYFVVIEFREEKQVEVGEPVIAWRVETHGIEKKDDVFSVCIPLTVDGDVVSNCIGVQNPDKTITVFEDSNYSSLEDLRQQRFKK